MREIKFRFWKNEEMTHWEELAYLDICDWLNQENIIAMQFTGLLDKNGKEVYEGDILQIDWLSPAVVVVKWKAQGWSPFIKQGNTDWEVIGNIYENPELLQLKEI